MAPEERREAIIAATLPLLLEQGPELSTRAIAQAAGVAEGTIFRAFGTKHDLIHATISAALAPDAAIASLQNLPDGQSLDERVAAILELLRSEMQRTRSLFVHLAQRDARDGRRPWPPFPPHDKKNHPKFGDRARLTAAVTVALEAYSDRLAVPTDVATTVLSALSFASLTLLEDEPLSQPAALTAVVLHGIAKGDS